MLINVLEKQKQFSVEDTLFIFANIDATNFKKVDNGVYFQNNDISVLSYIEDENIVIDFNTLMQPETINLKVSGVKSVNQINNAFYDIVDNNNDIWELYLINVSINLVNDVWQLVLNKTDAQIRITKKTKTRQALVHTLTNTYTRVYSGQRPPEFTVRVYDDAGGTIFRPHRYGIPVVSTMPSIDDGSTIPTDTRLIYFKCTPTYTPSILPSPAPVLKLYTPAGLDTVAPANFGDSNTSVTISWTPSVVSFTFHKEDNEKYVDGFAYAQVHLNMNIDFDLPIRMQIIPDTSSPIVSTNTYEDPNLY